MNAPSRSLLTLLLAAAVLLALAPAALGAPGSTKWERTWNVAPGNIVYGVRVAAAATGDVYLCACMENGAARADWVVVRYTATGAKKWSRIYSGPVGTEWLEAVAADASGNVVVVGSSDVATDDPAFTVVKWSRAGVRKWVRRIDGRPAGSDDSATDVVVDGAGNVYVCGSVSRTATGVDWLVVKYSPGGKTLWQRWYRGNAGGDGFETARAIALDSRGRIYVAGTRRDGPASGTGDACIARYTASGHRDWLTAWGHVGDISDYPTDIVVGKAGMVVVGSCAGPSTQTAGIILKRRLSGTGGWSKTLGGSDGTTASFLNAAGIDDAGRVAVAGAVKTSEEHGFDFALRRYAAAGGFLNEIRMAGTDRAQDTCWALRLVPGGTVYATGTVDQMLTGGDARTLAYSKTWAPVFDRGYDSPTHGEDNGQSLAVTSGAVYVAGRSAGDAWLIKYER
jgi:uncharacterized delta-60 repeat protein